MNVVSRLRLRWNNCNPFGQLLQGLAFYGLPALSPDRNETLPLNEFAGSVQLRGNEIVG